MHKISPIYIAFGANLSNPRESFLRAVDMLAEAAIRVEAMSSLWQSPAWPAGQGQPDYINAVARVDTTLSARLLLVHLHRIESELGRVRGERNAPRTLDLDLLDCRGEVIDAPDITIPHPRMMVRGFVLFPLSEVAPDWRHPITDMSIEAAIARLPLADVAPMKCLGPLQSR